MELLSLKNFDGYKVLSWITGKFLREYVGFFCRNPVKTSVLEKEYLKSSFLLIFERQTWNSLFQKKNFYLHASTGNKNK